MISTGNSQINSGSLFDDYYGSEDGVSFRILDSRRRFIKESIMYWGGNPDNILDLGCGDGELFSYLDRIYYRDNYPAYAFYGVGVDFCGKTLLRNAKRANKYTWLCRDLEQEINLNNQFDFIFCGETIEHL